MVVINVTLSSILVHIAYQTVVGLLYFHSSYCQPLPLTYIHPEGICKTATLSKGVLLALSHCYVG